MAEAVGLSGGVDYAVCLVSLGSGNARLQIQGSEAHAQRESEMRGRIEIRMTPSSSSFLRKPAFFSDSIRQLNDLKQKSPPFLC